jgi:hypothetical protein
MACARVSPHIGALGRSDAQTAGRVGRPKSWHLSASFNCSQRTPAGLPPGMPGMAELIEGAMQQAAQAGRQFMQDASPSASFNPY